MNDREYAAQKKRIQKLADKWLQPLGLLHWKVQIEFCREGIDDECGEGNAVAADCTTSWEYLETRIRWSMPVISRMDDRDLEMVFVHECMHTFLAEAREPEGQALHEERVATMLAKAFLWVADYAASRTKKGWRAAA